MLSWPPPGNFATNSNQTISVWLKKKKKHVKSFRAFPWLLHISVGEERNPDVLWSEAPCQTLGLVSKVGGRRGSEIQELS